MKSLNKEEKEELNDIFETLAETLDITETQYNNLKKSYSTVGDFLGKDSNLSLYRPLVTPQGSLRLGTIIQPINPTDDLDVDLVFRLTEKNPEWAQKDLKDRVGKRLMDSELYSRMLDKEGRRCWTLLYRDNSDNPKEKYHMDILPAVADIKYPEKMIRLYSDNFSYDTINQISIRITDKNSSDYKTSTNTDTWLKSNPDGYAFWFASRCKENESIRTMSESIIPIDRYTKDKTVLQRIVQILKRHRDIMFRNDTENKPISIIITTLAAKAYHGEQNVVDGLIDVVTNMEHGITKGYNGEDWIANPVNLEENFADKWTEHPLRRENFYKWMNAVKKDLFDIFSATNQRDIRNFIRSSFGNTAAEKSAALLVERRNKKLAAGTALLSSTGEICAKGKKLNTKNIFYGKK